MNKIASIRAACALTFLTVLASLTFFTSSAEAAPPCFPVSILSFNGRFAGCYFSRVDPTNGPYECTGTAKGLLPVYSYGGTCLACVEPPLDALIRSGDWTGFFVGGRPADFSCTGCIDTPANLVAWYPFDEDNGFGAVRSTADLAAGNNGRPFGNPDFIVNDVFNTGDAKVHNALKFDGVNDYVDIPNRPQNNFGTGDFSIDFWINMNPVDIKPAPDNGIILQKAGVPLPNQLRGYTVAVNSSGLHLSLADGTTTSTVYPSGIPNGELADGRWHLVAVTVHRSAGIQWYFDGKPIGPVGNATLRPGSLTNDRSLRVGRSSFFAFSAYFKGKLDELELFNRVLTPQEVFFLFRAQSLGKCKPLTDLVVTAVIDPPAVVLRGTSFTASDRTQNIQVENAAPSTTRYFLSTDGETKSIFLSGRSVPALATGVASMGNVNLTVPLSTPIGNYALLACADGLQVVPETDETNNCTLANNDVSIF